MSAFQSKQRSRQVSRDVGASGMKIVLRVKLRRARQLQAKAKQHTSRGHHCQRLYHETKSYPPISSVTSRTERIRYTCTKASSLPLPSQWPRTAPSHRPRNPPTTSPSRSPKSAKQTHARTAPPHTPTSKVLVCAQMARPTHPHMASSVKAPREKHVVLWWT